MAGDEKNMKKRLVVIDGNSLLYRSFFALPQLSTTEGIATNGIYGFLNIYYRIIEDYSPDYISVVFDKKGDTFRHKQYENYKAGRAKMPDELGIQFPILKEILDTLNIKYLEMDGYEADDIAGTLARVAEAEGIETVLVSGDKDYLQLVDENTKVIINVKGISQIKMYDKDEIEDEFEGLTPNQLIDLKGLMGDSSDNIPGVPGIGPKTGIKLLKEYGSIEDIYRNIDGMKKSSMKNKLEMYRAQAAMSKSLATIFRNVPIEISIEDLKYKKADDSVVLEKFREYELKSLYGKVSDGLEEEATENDLLDNINFNIIESIEGLDDIIEEINKEIYLKACYEEDSSITGLGLIIEDEYYYIDLCGPENNGDSELSFDIVAEKLKGVLEDTTIFKYGHNIKEEILSFKRKGVEFENAEYDAMVALYLINPSLGNYTIQNISREILKITIPDEKEILGTGKKKKKYWNLDLEDRARCIIVDLAVIKKTREKLEKDIHDMEMDELFNEVEMPLTVVLADMEYRGFNVDMNRLDALDKDITEKMDSLVAIIHEMADEDFNINSPKQLSEILFEKLELPVIKKTKTGYSTDAEVLEKLENKHPIVKNIIEYRQIAKLKSTYIDGLRSVVDNETGRIHSKFNQTITATGRISSTEPNLQNIPIRTEEGRKIRQLFISESDDYKLVDADYSQIELRVLAHISDDEKLKSAFYEESDIHTKTASEVFNVSMDQVTSDLRSKAKAVNFGIIYGISDFGLSRDLKITRKEAKQYIDSYLENYPKVKEYMEEIVKKGKKMGYVETIMHRRRYIPELKSRNFNIRGFGERIALNTPIQGSAADIIKVAMVEVYRELKKRKCKSKLILQVHDELIIEAHVDELEDIKVMLKDLMESAVKLNVPLEVDMKVGDSWYDTK